MKRIRIFAMALAMLTLCAGFAEELDWTDPEQLPTEMDLPLDEALTSDDESGTADQFTADALALAPLSATMDYSQSVTLTATASSGAEGVTWSTSNESVAELSATSGGSVNVTGVNEGTATITCTLGEQVQTCEVKVNTPGTLQIMGVDYPATLLAGQGGWRVRNGTVASTVDLATLTTVIKNADGETIGSPYTRTFDRGVKRFDIREIDSRIPFAQVSTEGIYTWTLYATDVNGRSVSMNMPVNAVTEGETAVSNNPGVYSPIVFASSITLDNAEIALPLGVTKALAATIMPANAIDDVLIWTSDDPSIATVSPNGEVTTVGLGTATIICKALYNDEVSANCVVTVSADVVPEETPAENLDSAQSEKNAGDGINLISRSLMDGTPDQIAERDDVIRSGYGWEYAANSGNIVGQTLAGRLALQQNTEYTVSFVAWARADVQMYVDLYPDTLPETRVDLTPMPTRYIWTFYSDSPDMRECSLRFFRAGGFKTWVNVVDVKLERGNVATDWSEPVN